jgi:hypothetical protein
MYLDQDLVGIVIGTLKKPTFMSKNPPSTSSDENVVDCSTSIGC